MLYRRALLQARPSWAAARNLLWMAPAIVLLAVVFTTTNGFEHDAGGTGHDSGTAPDGPQLIRAVSELHSVVLAEAQHLIDEPTGSAALRVRMEEHIDTHLSDPDLNPETVAAAVGISLRHAHNVFNDGERTISRFIRERRTEAVAFFLRTSARRLPSAELAANHGFVSTDSMSRAFRDRFGMSPSEYRAGGHRTLG